MQLLSLLSDWRISMEGDLNIASQQAGKIDDNPVSSMTADMNQPITPPQSGNLQPLGNCQRLGQQLPPT